MLSEMSNLKCVAKYFDFSDYVYRDFLSYEDLKIAVKKAGIFSCEKYKKQYKDFKGWPSNPNIVYKKEWKGWRIFFGKVEFPSYRTLKIAVKKAGIFSYTQYYKQYKKFDSWPASPDKFYKKEWKSWLNFFDREKRGFLSYEDFKIAVKKAGIFSCEKYKKQYKKFKGWPSNPNIVYKKEWKSWPNFFDRERDFLSYADLKIAVKKAGVFSPAQYRKQYKDFDGWPSNPNHSYEEWKSWPDFFDKEKKNFLSYEDLKIAVKKAGIFSYAQYYKQYKKFDSWPASPDRFYKKEWKGWPDFFDREKKKFLSYEDLKIAVKKAGIFSEIQYKKHYKNFKSWPSNPNATYKKEWKSWPIFFDKR